MWTSLKTFKLKFAGTASSLIELALFYKEHTHYPKYPLLCVGSSHIVLPKLVTKWDKVVKILLLTDWVWRTRLVLSASGSVVSRGFFFSDLLYFVTPFKHKTP